MAVSRRLRLGMAVSVPTATVWSAVLARAEASEPDLATLHGWISAGIERDSGGGMVSATANGIPSTTFGAFRHSPAADWLRDNAHRFGFLLPYTPAAAGRTGYVDEPRPLSMPCPRVRDAAS